MLQKFYSPDIIHGMQLLFGSDVCSTGHCHQGNDGNALQQKKTCLPIHLYVAAQRAWKGTG
jgi:hypothetical protein